MEIRNCEFCNADITHVEIHNCTKVFYQHRERSATLIRSGNRAVGTDSRSTRQMNCEAIWPTVSQIHSSTQQLPTNKRRKLKHSGEERSKCDSCGAEFSSEESPGAHQCGKNN
ncbi:hypothetical protein CEXT_316791 [Caerostris extrusa]|uniref:C2H2-type domain-containing protein n=1 Tax=Caerostris extrusa TaxID=172846 RepID=A0AAV4WSI7_CAEEX|nr:hypothetical protein CEXT_316791 [Caerostris extrusa]